MVATTRAAKKEKDRAFRFLDLPPEVRNRIYGFYFADAYPDRINLANFKLPVISRVSNQVHGESLPIFFAERSFHITINSNFADAYAIRTNTPASTLAAPNKTRIKRAGTLGIRRDVKKFLNKVEANLILRDVQFSVLNILVLSFQQFYPQSVRYSVLMHLFITVTQGEVQAVIEEERFAHATPTRVRGFQYCDVEDAMTKAKKAAEAIADADGFSGFTLKDLEGIAKGFRFVPTKFKG